MLRRVTSPAPRFNPRRPGLQVEQFEDRAVPAVVTNLNETGAGSLRDALENTTDATVTFLPGLTGTIALTTAGGGDIVVNRSVTVTGPGAGVITISGSNETGIFNVNDGNAGNSADVVISGLRFTQSNTSAIFAVNENLTIADCVITGNTGASRGGGLYHYADGASLTIRNTTFSGNTASSRGGGLYTFRASAVLIEGAVFSGNLASGNNGGGAHIEGQGGAPNLGLTVRNSTFSGNSADDAGGGLYFDGNGDSFLLQNSTFTGNQTISSFGYGGALHEQEAANSIIENCTFQGNASGGEGGALQLDSTVTVRNSTISGNTASTRSGGGINAAYNALTLESTIVANNTAATGANPDIVRTNGATINATNNLFTSDPVTAGIFNGTASGNLVNTDPLLGPLQDNGGPTQTMALPANSPALNAGSNSGMPSFDQRGTGFPRTVGAGTDIGAFEFSPPPPAPNPVPPGVPVSRRLVVTPLSGGGVGAVFDDTATPLTQLNAFPGYLGNVLAATGDVTGDGTADYVLLASTGSGGHVTVFDGSSFALARSFFAFDGFLGATSVATGDVNGDGFLDVIVGAALNGHVKVFSGSDGSLLQSFLAFDGYAGAVSLSAGDLNGDRRADIVVGTATGQNHVKAFNGTDLSLLLNFFAFDAFAGGVNVGTADFDADGFAEIIVGAGTNGHVKVFSRTGAERASLFAFPGFTGPVSVGGWDADADGDADLVVGTRSGFSHVKAFDGRTLTALDSFFAFSSPTPQGIDVS